MNIELFAKKTVKKLTPQNIKSIQDLFHSRKEVEGLYDSSKYVLQLANGLVISKIEKKKLQSQFMKGRSSKAKTSDRRKTKKTLPIT